MTADMEQPSFRTRHARNPCDLQVRREFSGDDAQESGIDRTCSRRLIRRPWARRARIEQHNHEQTDACGNRTAAMFIAEGHVRPILIHDSPKGPCMQLLVRLESHFRPLANEECAFLES